MISACRKIVFSLGIIATAGNIYAQQTADVWLTDPAQQILFRQQAALKFTAAKGAAEQPVITIDDQQKFQGIDGFGFALTGGSAQHIHNMSVPARAALLQELFGTKGEQIGTSYLRLSIGASDLDEHVFSYDDLPNGETDTALKHFDLSPDYRAVIPVMKEILKINPAIKILGSPWSAPAWMKTNNDTRGGSLKPEYYPVYANYFVRYIQAMKKEGIRIDAITIQNEPLHPGNNPSMFMPAAEQAVFVRDYLGPVFKRAGIRTKIIIYDHNADKPDYPISILNDEKARQYIDGSAFHLYGGKIEALSDVHNAYPDKHLYFTEQWVGAPGNFKKDIAEHIRNLVIGATRNWSRNVIEWNLAANSAYKPHTDRGGCDRCLGAVTIDQDSVKRNPAYYIIAHAAKFVRPGSVRVATEITDNLKNVAFRTPQGKTVLIVLNDNNTATAFNIRYRNKNIAANLPAGATATYVF